MSILTELPEHLYPRDLFPAFSQTGGYGVGAARAMMWLSQLAYEADQGKIGRIAERWGLVTLAHVPGDLYAILELPNTETIVAGKPDAVIVAFAGTDPLRLANWITDFSVDRSDRDTHRGFQAAIDMVGQTLDAQVELARTAHPGAALYFTGHSLGGALAVLAAQRSPHAVAGVYTFGMPRVGGEDFERNYRGRLGERTHRLRFGRDLVPSIPTRAQGFRHVGRYVHCPAGRFADVPDASIRNADEPDLLGDAHETLRTLLAPSWPPAARWGDRFRSWLRPILDPPVPPRPDLVGILLEQLPPPIGDHLPHRYCAALA
jgi:hypothetical protein